LSHGWDRPSVISTTVAAITQRVPAQAIMRGLSFIAQTRRQVDVEGLDRWLTDMGFTRASTEIERRDVAARAGLIYLCAPGDNLPVRLDFFGDVLEGARRFDPETQRTVEKIKRVELAPASEVILDPESIQRFRT